MYENSFINEFSHYLARVKANEIKQLLRDGVPLFDVRSPSEFEYGHIPGAMNLPLFSNDERAEVGTLYKQVNKDVALEKGLEFVGPKMKEMVLKAKEAAPGKEAIVYCWRGGMRSEAMQWLLNFAGFKTQKIQGGYKAFRNEVLQTIEHFSIEAKWQVIGGMTGCGKTEILQELDLIGAQVIDLEGLANHRGSAFGHFLLGEQPSTEHFMNLLYSKLIDLDIDKTIWIEDESRLIGSVVLPPVLNDAITKAPLVVVNKTIQERSTFLADVYGKAEFEDFSDAFDSIKNRLNGPNVKEALSLIKDRKLEDAAQIAFLYYDKAYTHSLEKRRSKHQQFQEEFDATGQTFSQSAALLKAKYND